MVTTRRGRRISRVALAGSGFLAVTGIWISQFRPGYRPGNGLGVFGLPGFGWGGFGFGIVFLSYASTS
jgi:hypothetical protein